MIFYVGDVMPEGGGGRVCMTNNVEGCIKKTGGGEVKMPQNSMTSFMEDPLRVMSRFAFL